MDSVFKTLFGTLHMSGGHIRFNGSFVKRLPMPNYFPLSLSYLGKINQFLSQLIYEQNNLLFNSQEIAKYHNFFLNLSDTLVSFLYLQKILDKTKFKNLLKLLNQPPKPPEIFQLEFKYLTPRFNLPKFKIYSEQELQLNLISIENSYKSLNDNKILFKEINELTNQDFHL